MKPNDGLGGLGHQLICPSDVEVKTEVEDLISSPASDALQLIFQDSQVDPRSIMLDLTDMLRRDPTLSSLNPPPRLQQGLGQVNGQSGVPIPKRSALSQIMDRGQVMDRCLIMERSQVMDMQLELDDMSGPTTNTESSSFGAYGAGSSTLGSSYGASPLAPTSPGIWEIPVTQVKQEELDPMNSGPGLCMSGGQRLCLSPQNPHSQICLSPPNNQDLYVMQNAGPTLAQLNSPPQEDAHNMLRGITELTDINLDVLMAPDLMPQSFPMVGGGVKEEYPQQYDRGLSSQFPSSHSSVPTSNMMSDLQIQDLSNLSNGGPALSPNHLTLSPTSRLSLSPNPPHHNQTNIQIMSPMPQSRASIIKTAPAAKTVPSHSTLHASSTSHSTLHDLLMRKDPTVHDPIRPRSNSNQFKAAKTRIAPRQRSSLSASNPLLASQLSKSLPINNSVPVERMIWSRRDPRPHINSVNSVAGDSSIADEVQEALSSLSPSDLNDIDSEEEDIEDEESDLELNIDEDVTPGSSVKKDRFFWQYNVQAKGPKGHKIALLPKINDPFTLDEVIDPVFSDEIQVHGIKHSGKARRGDGNDLTANPKKLAAIGKELESLGKIINEMAPVSEIPMPSRTTSRKEKNKLASRACRLKKKAQHEANKLKLHGLEEEHSDLLKSISQVKELLISKMSRNCELSQNDLTNEAEKHLKKSHKNRVSGLTTEYVNKMITKHS